jgi:hypothetical protein
MNENNNTRLYVVELSNNKIFLFVTTVYDNNKNDKQIELECQLMYYFVRENLPIISSKSIKIIQDLEVDFFVKKYMRYYGIDNVRGGSYCNSELTTTEHQFISNELKYNLIEECSKQYILREIIIKYENTQEKTDELHRLQTELIEFNRIKTKLSLLELSRDIIDDIEWIRDRIVYYKNNSVENNIINPSNPMTSNPMTSNPMTSNPMTSNPDKTRYRIILQNFKNIKQIFQQHSGKEIDYNPIIYINRPDIILDKVFYHAHNVNLNNESVYAVNILKYYEYMAYFLINRKEEFEFDLSTYPKDMEEMTTYSIEYIKLQTA